MLNNVLIFLTDQKMEEKHVQVAIKSTKRVQQNK